MLFLLLFYKLRLCCEAEYAAGGRIAVFWRPLMRSRRRVCLWVRRWDGSADNIGNDIGSKARAFIGRMKRLRRRGRVRRWLRVSRVDIRAALPGDPALAAMAGGAVWVGFGWLQAALHGHTIGDCRTDCRVSLAGEGGLQASGSIEVELRLVFLPLLLWGLLALWRESAGKISHIKNVTCGHNTAKSH